MDGVTILCFAASYTIALGLEVLQTLRPGTVRLVLLYGVAGAGFLAHTIYVVMHGRPLSGGANSVLFLSWILATFYLYGSIHHRQFAWGVFVLPVVLGLALIAGVMPDGVETPAAPPPQLWAWVWLHFALFVLGAVGLCVGFVASIMYLVQANKLKRKVPPGEGLHLLSLERLEEMNRRGINLAFPFFTGGLLIGILLLVHTGQFSWWDPKVLSTALLWLLFVVLLFLRYGLHRRGRQLALGTIGAFGLLLVVLVIHLILPSAHQFGGGV
jgi:ABC-type transport system involved in cytochrome c biogenesis permease subunit